MIDQIGVHVIGPSCGESIVIELPDGSVGVIDCFSSPHKRPAVLGFLQNRFPGLTRLRFLACTHPHADHLLGASCLAETFELDEFWTFRPFPAGNIGRYYSALANARTRDRLEAAMALPSGSMDLEILRLGHNVDNQSSQVRYLSQREPFRMCGGHVRVFRMTPDERAENAYNHQLSAAERSIASLANLESAAVPDVDHNLASGGLLFQFGKTLILLMADAEVPLWDEWLVNQRDTYSNYPVDFVKVSHHGSSNGYLEAFYSLMTNAEKTIAVLTPFNKGKTKLPTLEGAKLIARHVRDLYCTNITIAKDCTGLVWEETGTPPPFPDMPTSWVADCKHDTNLLHLLDRGVVADEIATASAAAQIPRRWLRDCQLRRELVRLLKPEFRSLNVSAAADYVADEFRLSIYFDDRGNEKKRETGYGVGRLVV